VLDLNFIIQIIYFQNDFLRLWIFILFSIIYSLKTNFMFLKKFKFLIFLIFTFEIAFFIASFQMITNLIEGLIHLSVIEIFNNLLLII